VLAIQDVEAKCRFVQDQQPCVNRHHQGEVQLRHHALGQFPHLAGAVDRSPGQKIFRLGTIEAGMHACNVIDRLRNPYPARKDSDVGNETDIAHESITFGPGVVPEYFQFSLIRNQTEDCVERGGLAGAVGADESEDAALFDAQIDAVERDLCAEGFAQAVCFYACHRSALLFHSGGRRAVGASLQQFFGF
jgi:hypothetical protein